ncbi:MAG: DNA-directed RNA polymerase subunit beta', partial [Candidatus Riflebacteria bacterium]
LPFVRRYLMDEIQRVYRDQGVSINDKHIEIIVRQMLRKVVINESGDSEFLQNESVHVRRFEEKVNKLVEKGKRPPVGVPMIQGITKASLTTDSFISAASFQETTRVLTKAAIKSKVDYLKGLKENLIIGKLIPAGTGLSILRDINFRNLPVEIEAAEANQEELYIGVDSTDSDNLDAMEDELFMKNSESAGEDEE